MTPQMTEESIEMTDLTPGRKALVNAIRATEAEALRLVGLGICEGRTVELVKTGSPLIVRVYGRKIGLSARLACQVSVDPIIEQSAPALTPAHATALI